MVVSFKNVIAQGGQSAAERYAAMVHDGGTFYIVGDNLYWGDVKISNAADLAAAVSDIADIESTLTTLQGDASVSGSIRNIIEEYISGGTDFTVTLEEAQTATTGYLKTYNFYQGDVSTAAAKTTSFIGKIDIPKDFLVKSAAIRTVETADVPYSGAVVGDKYIDFVVNTKDASATDEHIYLPVNELVDAYTANNQTAEVTIAIDANNNITATIGKVSGTKIIYQAQSGQPGDPDYVPEETVNAAITRLDGSITTVTNRLIWAEV